jgi:cytochrome c
MTVALAMPGQAAAPAREQVPDFATEIPMANVMQGEMIAMQCMACHDFTKGGPNKIGPNLYGVVGRPRASHPGYDYSPAMKMKGGNWSYADLFEFLKQPAVFIPGTKMTFAGLPKPQDRLNVIAWLRTQADMPAPLPPPQPKTANAAATAANGAAPAPANGAPAQVASNTPSTGGEQMPNFATAIPMANVMHGEMLAEQCMACHDFTKNGPNKIGPNLWGVVLRPRASHPGYMYSAAMKAKSGSWTYADLFQFLQQPQVFVPGTKMTFGGFPRPQDRLDVIAWLRMQADSPAPLR